MSPSSQNSIATFWRRVQNRYAKMDDQTQQKYERPRRASAASLLDDGAVPAAWSGGAKRGSSIFVVFLKVLGCVWLLALAGMSLYSVKGWMRGWERGLGVSEDLSGNVPVCRSL